MEYTDWKNKYQIVVIRNPYDLFDRAEAVRHLLAETWGMKMRGYKKYFEAPTLPNDHLDYICNHIIVCHRGEKLRPVAAVKNITLKQCQDFGVEMPIYNHLCKGREEEYRGHIEAMKSWIESKPSSEVAYSMGFTVEPTLNRPEKKFLCDYIFNLFYFFYTTYNIPNVIHGISKTFKLDSKQYPMGFKILQHQGRDLDAVKTKAYSDVESYVMVLEGFKDLFEKESLKYNSLWTNRIDITSDVSEDNRFNTNLDQALNDIGLVA